MNEDQIIARAQHEVGTRRAIEAARRGNSLGGGVRRWLPPALALAVLLAFFAAPTPLPRKLLLAMSGVCSLRPGHSYFAGGIQLPLESRMIGIYGGFLLTLACLLAFKRVGAHRLGGKTGAGLLLLLFASMVFDGINSTLAELRLSHLYAPTNALRLVTGLFAGIALAPLLVWLLGLVAAAPTEGRQRAVIRSPWELLAPLALNAVFAWMVINAHAALFYPIALIGVAGVVAVLTGAAMLPVLLIGGLEGRVTQARQLVVPGALAALAAFAILGGMAGLRWTLTGSFSGV